jgi:putative methyltransferase
MIKKNIYFSQVNYSTGSGKFKGYWFPYSVATIWAYVQQFEWVTENFQLQELLFKRETPEELLDRIEEPHIFCFSNYVWNYEYNKKIAEFVKKRYPNCIISFGGPQVTKFPKEKKFFKNHPYVDTISLGEGERNFLRILEDYQSNSVKQIYTFDRLEELDFPSPYGLGLFDKMIKDNPTYKWNAVLETNRGCPFKCTFCDWGSLTYSKLKKFNLERIFEDLEWMGKNKIGYGIIADANFGCFKERDMYITEKMVEVQKKYGYPETVDASWYKNLSKEVIDIVKKFVENGFNRGFSLSLQSMNEETLESIERANMKLNKFNEILDLCNEQQIPSYTELILGLPHETKDTWIRGITKLVEAGQHNSIESWLTQMLENSQLNQERDEHEFDTVFLDNYYTSQEDFVEEKAEIVRGTKYMPFKDLIDSWMFSWLITNLHIYGWTQIYSIFLRKNKEITFERFYRDLLDSIKSDDSIVGKEYRKTKKRVTHYLEGKKTVDYSGHTLLWDSQQEFHKNRLEVLAFTKSFYEKYDNTSDVIRAQEHFVTEYGVKEISISLNTNIYEFCYKNKPLKNKSKTYKLKIKEPYDTEDDYMRMFYFKRRQGWGKYKIINL